MSPTMPQSEAAVKLIQTFLEDESYSYIIGVIFERGS